MIKAGLIVFNLGGGDASFTYVDEARWDQLIDYQVKMDPYDLSLFIEFMDYLTDPEGNIDYNFPAREGSILRQLCTQRGVAEDADFAYHLIGIITD